MLASLPSCLITRSKAIDPRILRVQDTVLIRVGPGPAKAAAAAVANLGLPVCLAHYSGVRATARAGEGGKEDRSRR